MSHLRRARNAAAAIAIVTALCTSPGATQNLTRTTLAPLQDAASLFDGLIEHFGGGKRPVKAAIERVTVSEDTPRRARGDGRLQRSRRRDAVR